MHTIDRYIYRLHMFKHRPDGYEALTYSFFTMKFALGMVDTFGVIYIFQLANDWIVGLWLVAIYMFIQRFLVSLFLVPSGKVVNRMGYRKSMLAAVILLAGKIFLFTQVSASNLWPLLLAAFLGALHTGLYYLGYHGLFLDDNDDGRIGEQMGYLEMLGRLAAVVSPFIAGLVLERYGFNLLFGLGIVLLLISSIPLFLMPRHKHRKISVTFADMWNELKKQKRFSWSVGFMFIQSSVLDYFWPIYMFMIIGSYAAYGSVISLVMVVSSVVIFAMGRAYDKRPFHRLYPAASLMQAVLWFGRFAAQTMLGVVTADVLSRIMSPIWWMKIRRYELSKGEGMDSVVFGMAHEFAVSAGRMVGIVLAMSAMVLSGYNWMSMSVVAATSVLMAGFMVRNK